MAPFLPGYFLVALLAHFDDLVLIRVPLTLPFITHLPLFHTTTPDLTLSHKMGSTTSHFALILVLITFILQNVLSAEIAELPETPEDGVIFREPPIHIEGPVTVPEKLNKSSEPAPIPKVPVKEEEATLSVPVSVSVNSPEPVRISTSEVNKSSDTIVPVKKATLPIPVPASFSEVKVPQVIAEPVQSSLATPPEKFGNVPASLRHYMETMYKSAAVYQSHQRALIAATTTPPPVVKKEVKEETTTTTTTNTSTTPLPLPPIPDISAIISQLEKQKKDGTFMDIHPKLHLIPRQVTTTTTLSTITTTPKPPSVTSAVNGTTSNSDSRWLWDLFKWGGGSKEKELEGGVQQEVEYKEKTILKPSEHPLPGAPFYECPFFAVLKGNNNEKRSFFFF